jgi:DNA-directed RNA polymerase subunit RPC12/RpoP
MEGRCPDCNRAYDISEEFLAMGGKAKCPHCLLELEFAQKPRQSASDEARFRESTKPDPRSQTAEKPTEEVELDSHCASCGRHFKVDSEYLKMAGSAQCPHCGLDLVFDQDLSEPRTDPGEPGVDFSTQGEVDDFDAEIDDNDDQEYGIDSDDEREKDIPESQAASSGSESEDPWAATTELNLPELDLLRAEASGEAPALSHDESLSANEQELPEDDDEEDLLRFDDQVDEEDAADLELDNKQGFEEEQALDTGEISENEAGEDFDQHMGLGSEIAADAREQFSEPEDEWEAPDENVIVGKLEGFGTQEPQFAGEEISEEQEEEQEEEEEKEEEGEEGRDGEQEQEAGEDERQELAKEGEEIEEFLAQPEVKLKDEEEEAQDRTLPVEGPEDSWPVDGDDELPEDSALQADEMASQAEDKEPESVSPVKGQTGDQKQGEDKGVFAGLASSEDWATAAARWAESGFKADAIPSFIQDTEDAAEKEDSGAALQEEQEGSGQLLLAQQVEQAVEVSDADIMLLDEGEVDEVEDEQAAKPSSEGRESWAQRASRELSSKTAPTRAPAPQSWFSRVKSPPVVAGVIGLLVLIAGGLVWILMTGEQNIEKIAFPVKGLKVEVVKAPGPSAYKAKPTAVEHYGLGNRLAYHGKLEDAIIEYKQATHLDHGYPHPYRALGAIYAALGKRRLSLDAYQTYLRLSPHAPDRKQVRKIIKADHAK